MGRERVVTWRGGRASLTAKQTGSQLKRPEDLQQLLMNMRLDQSHLLNLYLVSVSGIRAMMVEWSPQLFIT